jgi:uncharacterized protein (DUF433 family)
LGAAESEQATTDRAGSRANKTRAENMDATKLLDRISVNPDVMVGKPTIRGLRITVEQILKALANEVKPEELLEDYPDLQAADIQAVLLYAARLVEAEKVYRIASG